MIKRRKKIGNSLLTAASLAGTTLVMSSCVSGKEVVSGNLMPPPDIELCIDVSPEDATVMVNSGWQEVEVPNGSCEMFSPGGVQIEATAENYNDYSAELQLYEDTRHEIDMVPNEDGDSGS